MIETRILVTGTSDAVVDALRAEGFLVEHFPSSNALLEAVQKDAPAVVLLGPIDGACGLCRQVKEAASRAISVLTLLASDDTQSIAMATQSLADDYVLPPHRVHEIVSRVHHATRRIKTEDEMERHKRDAAALLELSQTLSSSLSVPLILHSASRLMAQVIAVERCAIVMVDQARNEGVVVAVSEDRNIRDLRVQLSRYPEIVRVMESGAPLVVADTGTDPLMKAARDLAPGIITGTAIIFPILSDERVGGVFFLRSRQIRRHPSEREMQFGQTVANATGVALRNARLFEGARQSTERITREREQAEERLRDLQKYENFFEHAADGMVILDEVGGILYVNREGARQLGATKEELLAHPLSDRLAPDSAALLQTVLGEVMRGRYRKVFDLYVMLGDDEICLSCSAGAVTGEGRHGCMISFRDVTELREMQTELKTTKEFLENLIDSSVDAIIAADIKGNVILFNKGAEKVYGYKAEEVINKVHVGRLYPEGVASEIMVQLRSDNFGGRGKLEAMRKSVLAKNGEEIPVSLTASIIYEGGDEVATVGIFTDLRERLKIERKLLQAQERLIETEKATVAAQLAGAAAHELNQPLTSVLGYAEMMKRKIPEDSPLRRSVDIIFKEGERMADIVRKIGRITKYETKNYVGNTMIVDLDRASNPGGESQGTRQSTTSVHAVTGPTPVPSDVKGGGGS